MPERTMPEDRIHPRDPPGLHSGDSTPVPDPARPGAGVRETGPAASPGIPSSPEPDPVHREGHGEGREGVPEGCQ